MKKETEGFDAKINELKEDIKNLQDAVRKLQETGIRDTVLYHAIQSAAKRRHTGTPIPTTHIKFIIMGLKDIESYLFPKEKKHQL